MLQNEYSNTNKLPLNEWKIKINDGDGNKLVVAALDKYWAKKLNFTSYVCLLTSTGQIKTGVELEEWQYKATNLQREIEKLLRLRHHEFWSTMLYEKRALTAIINFLQFATPFYKIVDSSINTATAAAQSQYAQLLQLVVRVVCRLLTSREAADAWLHPKKHGELVYNNFLISVPMLIDLIIALGNSDQKNIKVLKTIFNSLLSIQPNYLNDIQIALCYFENAFSSIQTQIDNEGCEGAGGGAYLDEGAQTPYDDVVLYTLDNAYTLNVLLEVCTQALPLCDTLKLAQSIALFYDNALPPLYKHIHLINRSADSLVWLNEARQQFLNTFRSIANYYVETALQKTTAANAHKLVELLTECLTAQSFITDYQRQYPVEIDMQILQDACAELKEHKISFVVNGYQKAVSSDKAGTLSDFMAQERTENINRSDDEEEISNAYVAANTNFEGAATPKTNTVERDIDLEVTAVLDVLPDLGTGFIRRLLARYDNSEQAIAAIFDENLPPDLADSDKTEAYIPPDEQDKVFQQTGIRHFNVHDGDDYDIMTKDKPNCIIKQGKGFPGAAATAEQLLDDKKELKALKERYQQYSLVEEYEKDDGDAAEYDDEYDDSYEAMLEGQPAQSIRKSKELKTRMADAITNITESDENSDDDETGNRQTPQRDTRKDFCENPEDVRARYAARQQAKWGHKQTNAPHRDVVGVAKGQGQSKETQQNRNKKEANKSSRANHNRKSGAAFKRSKGMVP